MVQNLRSRLIQPTVSSSRGLPWAAGKCSYKCTQTLSATCWHRERLLRMLCFQLYPRPWRPRDGCCSDGKMTCCTKEPEISPKSTTLIDGASLSNHSIDRGRTFRRGFQVSQKPSSNLDRNVNLKRKRQCKIISLFLLARAIVANYARHQINYVVVLAAD